MKKKKLLSLIFLTLLSSLAFSVPLYSPSWGFSMDLPEGYEYIGGDGKDTFSFKNSREAQFDLVIYYAASGGAASYASPEALALDIGRKINNRGDSESFDYRQKKAVVFELAYTDPRAGSMSGWAFCVELGSGGSEQAKQPALLLAMAYGPAEKTELEALHFSALDSIAPEERDRLAPGPITEFCYPREKRIQTPVFGLGINAWIFEEDAEAAQALIDREFQVLKFYENAPNWKEAWIRFYRAIYRDSFERLADIAFQVERKMNVPPRENRDFAEQVLKWVQSFKYEREFFGSDFINLVSAATEGRGDCDNRAMLWALILQQADIPAAMMVSRHYSHAMGLAELPGTGARFELEGQKLLVAETTANVSVGLISETVSEIEHWLGIWFD